MKQKINQEDFLIEVSEILKIELHKSGMTNKEFMHLTGISSQKMLGLLDGFANITLRELADVFTAFDKVISINLVDKL